MSVLRNATPQGDALAKLVTAARIGDQDAISALYEKTYSKVYYTVKSMIKDEDAVFDIVQDTYIKAFAHLARSSHCGDSLTPSTLTSIPSSIPKA